MERPPRSDYIDEHGAITQHPKFGADEGDSAHREATLALGHLLTKTTGPKDFNVGLFWSGSMPGHLVRHNKATRPWIRELNRGSRDQSVPWWCVTALRQHLFGVDKPYFDDVKSQMHLVKGRGWRFTNYKKNGRLDAPDKKPDWCPPEMRAMAWRAGVYSYPRWLIALFDVETLVGTIIWNLPIRKDNDICNHLSICATAAVVKPTWVSKLAWKWLNKKKAIKLLKQYWDWDGFAKPGEEWKDAWWVAEPWIKLLEEEDVS